MGARPSRIAADLIADPILHVLAALVAIVALGLAAPPATEADPDLWDPPAFLSPDSPAR